MGKIVIVSSHILPELEGFCNTVGIIERGELLACGPVADIIRHVQQGRIIALKVLERPGETIAFLCDQPHVGHVEQPVENELRFEFRGSFDDQAELLAALVQAGYRPMEFRESQADLEDVFLKLTTGAVN